MCMVDDSFHCASASGNENIAVSTKSAFLICQWCQTWILTSMFPASVQCIAAGWLCPLWWAWRSLEAESVATFIPPWFHAWATAYCSAILAGLPKSQVQLQPVSFAAWRAAVAGCSSASAVQMLHSCSLFNRVDLIKPVSNVRPSVSTFCLCVRTGTYARPSTKSFFDFNKIWHVGRGWWVMHNGVQYDPILSQSHEPLKVGNLAILKSYLLCHLQWELATDHWFLN